VFTFLKKILFLRFFRVGEACVVMHNAYYDNYYHFTSEALPRLFLVKERLKDMVVLLPESPPGFIIEYLNFFEFKKLEYIKHSELALVKSLLVPSFTARGLSHRPEVINGMREWFSQKCLNLTSRFCNYRNVYISRSKAKWRRVLNEAEVIEVISGYGFEVIHLEDYSVNDQIALFNNIRNLIGVHGAGLTNIMHMPSGALFISLIHITHMDPAFYNLSAALGHKSIIVECSGPTDPRGKAYNDIIVDVSLLTGYLDTYLAQQSC
jgi:capsular polysaccharide biosynthesis protein